MAQQEEFNLVKPPAYHWDFLVLSGLVSGIGARGRGGSGVGMQGKSKVCIASEVAHASKGGACPAHPSRCCHWDFLVLSGLVSGARRCSCA